MTAHRDLKRIIRERQKKTRESYTAARAHVLRDRGALLGLDADPPATTGPIRIDAVVLKVNEQSARVRILGEEDQVIATGAPVVNQCSCRTFIHSRGGRPRHVKEAFRSGRAGAGRRNTHDARYRLRPTRNSRAVPAKVPPWIRSKTLRSVQADHSPL